jgi:hypothetical protein
MKTRKKEIRMKEERKGTKIMEPDGPLSLRVHETYPNNIVSLRGITYYTAPSSDF